MEWLHWDISLFKSSNVPTTCGLSIMKADNIEMACWSSIMETKRFSLPTTEQSLICVLGSDMVLKSGNVIVNCTGIIAKPNS